MRFLFLILSLAVSGTGCAARAPIVRSYQSPEETFETWRQAVERLDFETLIASYATSAKTRMRREIEQTSEEGLRSMRDETRKTKFEIQKIVYEKDRAYLRTIRKLRNQEDLEVVVMLKEGREWKLLP